MDLRDFLLGVVFATLLAVGLTMGSSGHGVLEFWVARACFAGAAATAVGAYVHWVREKPRSRSAKGLLGILTVVVVCVGFPAMILWVNARAQTPSPAAQGTRVYLPDSFAQKYVALVAEGSTDPQERALLQPEIGRWMHLQGKLLSINTIGDELYALVEAPPPGRDYIGVFFSSQWSYQLSLIKPGETISFDVLITPNGNGPPKLAKAELR